MTTEDEAKEKWCPFSRRASFNGEVSFNRDWNGFPEGCGCLGSSCMAWVDEGTDDEWRALGRCGLAGKP